MTPDPKLDAAVDAWLADPSEAGLDAIETAAADAPALDGEADQRRASVLARARAARPAPPPPPPAANNRRWFLAAGIAAMAAAALLVLRTPQGPLLLSPEEAALPPLERVSRGEGAPRGPALSLVAPAQGEVAAGAFPLELRWQPSPGGAAVEPKTFRLLALRGEGIDITDRLGTPAGADGVRVPTVRLPEGTHAFEASVLDADGEEGRLRFELRVR